MAPQKYSGDSWTQLPSRPQGFGDGLYEDLPHADWVKVLLEIFVFIVIVVLIFKKMRQQSKFKRSIAMSEEVGANLSPEMQAKVKKASGYGLGDVFVVSGIGLSLLVTMWIL